MNKSVPSSFPVSVSAALITGLLGVWSVAGAQTAADIKVDTKTDIRADGKAKTERPGEFKSSKDRDTAAAAAFVTVNGAAQPVAMAEVLLREQLLRGVPDSAELRNGVRDALVANALMEQEAKKAGLDRNALVQAQMEMARQRVLVNAWQQKVVSDANISDADVTAEYNRQLKTRGGNDLRIRQVLVADEVGAKLLLEKARAGSKVEDLAKEYSREPNAKTNGGLSDWINSADLLPALADAVKDVPKGKLVDRPVQTPNGWHVVMVEDIRAFKAPALDDVKPQLASLLQQRVLQEKLKGLREKASVK